MYTEHESKHYKTHSAFKRPGGTRRTVAGPAYSSTAPGHRDLIIHGMAHNGANGAAMPTDEDDHDDNFLLNHPDRGGDFAAV